jgi:hypothetical protein
MHQESPMHQNASMHQASIFCCKAIHVQDIIGIANFIYQICKDNRANKQRVHGEKNLQRPPMVTILLSIK